MPEYEYNPRSTMPEDAKWVAPHEGHEHGYWGAVPDQEPNESYTVAGVTAEKPEEKKPAARHSRQSASKDDAK